MPLSMEVCLSPGNFVLDADPPPLPKKGAEPPILGLCLLWPNGGWIKMALGIEVGLGPGHIVLDGDPAPLPKKGAEPPIFSPFLLWPNGWMHQDATWYGGRPRPRRHCIRWGPNLSPKKNNRAQLPPQFSAHVC